MNFLLILDDFWLPGFVSGVKKVPESKSESETLADCVLVEDDGEGEGGDEDAEAPGDVNALLKAGGV